MLDVFLDPIIEKEFFTAGNLDPDCSTIGRLLCDYGEKFILSALEDGEYAIAVDNYLQLLDSLYAHFISDEYWCGLMISTRRITP